MKPVIIGTLAVQHVSRLKNAGFTDRGLSFLMAFFVSIATAARGAIVFFSLSGVALMTKKVQRLAVRRVILFFFIKTLTGMCGYLKKTWYSHPEGLSIELLLKNVFL